MKTSHVIGAVCPMSSRLYSRLLGWICGCTLIFMTFPASSLLIHNGGGLIYDTVLDITWGQPNIVRTWTDSNDWAAGLTLGGVNGWRLPYISVTAGEGPITTGVVDCSTATELACRDSELGYMFYYNLSGTFQESILTSGDPNLALFPTLESGGYWSGTESDPFGAWIFLFNAGTDGVNAKANDTIYRAWAVHDGNVVAPLPAGVWLFVSGLLGLIGVSRRKKTA